MSPPAKVIEINLNPGEHFFGGGHTRLITLLGSCVAITLWHRRLRQGGMCHYLLPGRQVGRGTAALDGRYADDALAILCAGVEKTGAPLSEYELGVFGGGSMFPESGAVFGGRVGTINIEAAQHFAKQHRLHPAQSDIGSSGYRKVVFDLHSGRIEVKYSALDFKPEQCVICKNGRACFKGGCRLWRRD